MLSDLHLELPAFVGAGCDFYGNEAGIWVSRTVATVHAPHVICIITPWIQYDALWNQQLTWNDLDDLCVILVDPSYFKCKMVI